jgi:hypothetical protein
VQRLKSRYHRGGGRTGIGDPVTRRELVLAFLEELDIENAG